MPWKERSSSSRIMLALTGTLAALVVIWAVQALIAVPPEVTAPSRTVESDAGRYRLRYQSEPEAPAIGETHAWILTLRASDGDPVDNAKIAVDGGMPAHGHGLPTVPQVRALPEPGGYRIEGLRFTMAGKWRIRIQIDAPRGKDVAVFWLDF